MKTHGPLHNDVTISVKDATIAQINASIVWYEKTLAKYLGIINTPAKWTDSLAILKAERANRIGKK
jgi:hypothetical protein